MIRIYETLQEEVNQIWSSEQKSNYIFFDIMGYWSLGKMPELSGPRI